MQLVAQPSAKFNKERLISNHGNHQPPHRLQLRSFPRQGRHRGPLQVPDNRTEDLLRPHHPGIQRRRGRGTMDGPVQNHQEGPP